MRERRSKKRPHDATSRRLVRSGERAHGEDIPRSSEGMSTAEKDRLADAEFAFSERKEPLSDAAHVRNAIARFDQVEGVTDEERDQAWQRIPGSGRQVRRRHLGGRLARPVRAGGRKEAMRLTVSRSMPLSGISRGIELRRPGTCQGPGRVTGDPAEAGGPGGTLGISAADAGRCWPACC